MALIALIILLMTSGCMRRGNVGALQGILFAAWAGADNAGGRTRHSLRGRFHNTGISNSGCSTVGVGVHAVQIVKISVAAVGSRPIIGVERHRCFRVANDVGDIERVAGIRFAPERILADAVQNRFAVVHGQRGELRAVVKGVLANGRREGQLCGGQIDTALEPVRQIWDGQRFHVLKPDLGDLVADSRPRLIVSALEHRRFAAAGDGQPTVGIQRPLDTAAWNRAGRFGLARSGLHGDFFIWGAFIDCVFIRFRCKCSNGQGKHHAKGQHKCGEFLEILHYAASFSFTAAIVKITVAALMFVTASLAETFAL